MHVVKMRPAPVRWIIREQFISCPSRVFSRIVLPLLLTLSISSIGLSGCGGIVVLSGSKSSTADAPTIAATPASVDFGSVGLGSTVDQKISLTNKGSDSVQISQLSLSNAAFHVDGEGKLPVTLAAGSSMSLNVHFSPSTESDSSDQLNVMTSSSSTVAVAVRLHGKGSSGSADLSGLKCDAATMSDAGSTSCTITTSIAAPSAGLQVKLSSNSSAIIVPTSVTVPAGASTAKFSATVSKVSSEEAGIITATHGSTSKSFSISLSPATAAAGAPELKSLSCITTSFSAAGKTTCALSLSAKPSKPLSVALSSTSSAVVVPATATVASGSTTASFVATVAATSTTQTATIVATSNGTSRNVSIQLKPSKTGASSAALSLSSASLQFGDVAVGTAVTKSVTVTSTGNAPVNIKSDATTGTGFSVSGGNFPASLSPGQAVVLTIHFNPTVAGSASGLLTIASSAGTETVALSGNGATATPTLSALTCGTSTIAGSLADSCKVTLSGAAPRAGVTIALASSSTSVKVPASITIPATATTANFTATAAAVSVAQTVKITAIAGSVSKSISLQLSPALSQLSVDATTISFGSVTLNQTTTQIVTLSSVGKAAVTVKSIAVSGTGFSFSSVSLPATLNPGQTLALTLVYKTSITGSQNGSLTITSDSSTNPTLTINLTASTSGHRVELSWNAPASSSVPVSSYSVYRATGTSSSFAKIGSSGQPGYTDSAVQAGSSYKYYVTSVASTGESKPSNTYTVTIP